MQRHLLLERIVVGAAEEESLSTEGWCFALVTEGIGYWICDSGATELDPGDVLIVPSGKTSGRFRASLVGPLQLEMFRVFPPLLGGVLTVGERQALEELAKTNNYWKFNEQNEVSLHFAELGHSLRPANALQERCELLDLAVSFFVDHASLRGTSGVEGASAKARFETMIDQLTEAEICEHSVSELAERCSCSVRHFSRLFQRRFGDSFRSYQLKQRMSKACRMLVETNTKVRDVAFASGYRHLGLFNVHFRREFGVTPTECRHSNRVGPGCKEA